MFKCKRKELGQKRKKMAVKTKTRVLSHQREATGSASYRLLPDEVTRDGEHTDADIKAQ